MQKSNLHISATNKKPNNKNEKPIKKVYNSSVQTLNIYAFWPKTSFSTYHEMVINTI